MAGKLAIFLAISAIVSGVHSDVTVQQNHKEVTVKEGEGVELICTSTTEALGCLFKSPTGVSYNMLKGATFEQGRIAQQERNPEDCAMKIDQITESDNGEWECSVTVKGPTGDYDIGNGQVQVVVAVPPSEVHLQTDGQRITGPIQMNLDEQKQVFVDCVATGARPMPEFSWFIGDTKLNANIQRRDEESDDGKITSISTLEYNAAPKHSGEMLRCEVEHMGYTMVQLEDRSNMAEAQLNLQFKPDDNGPQTFYEMTEGESNMVWIKFRANPKPTTGQWKIGEVTVPVGATSIDESFSSSQFVDGDLSGQYQVSLTFTMTPELANKNYVLEVQNEVGTTSYEFNLALSGKPAAETASGPVIGIIILVVIIILVGGITVIARAKGALCFGAKSGEPLEEEKEAFDDAEKGKLAPSGGDQVKSTPDKKPADDTKTETEDNKEDKKSNGAHTPV